MDDAIHEAAHDAIAPLRTPAELFLMELAARTPFGTPHGLNVLPFALYPAVARAMEQYAAHLIGSMTREHKETTDGR